MLEGSRAFDIAWGTTTGTICFALGALMLYGWVRARRSGAASPFGADVDPGGRLQFGYGLFAMVMGGTNYGCRFIDHRYLEAVHEGWFLLTLGIVGVLVPLVFHRTRPAA